MLGEIEHEDTYRSDRARLERMARDAACTSTGSNRPYQWLPRFVHDPNPGPDRGDCSGQNSIGRPSAEDQRYYFRNLEISQTTVMSKTSRPPLAVTSFLPPREGASSPRSIN